MNAVDFLVALPRIFAIQGKPVVLDRDLAGPYGAKTQEFNQVAWRGQHRFLEDFAFQLQWRKLPINTALEVRLLNALTHGATLCDHYQKLRLLLLLPSGKSKRRIDFHQEDDAP